MKKVEFQTSLVNPIIDLEWPLENILKKRRIHSDQMSYNPW